MQIEIGVYKDAVSQALEVGIKSQFIRNSDFDEAKLSLILEQDLSSIIGKLLKFYHDNGQKVKGLPTKGGLI